MKTLGQMLDDSKSAIRTSVANARQKASQFVAGRARHPSGNQGVAAAVHNARNKVSALIRAPTLADNIVVRSRSGQQMVAPSPPGGFKPIGYRRKG